MAEDTQTPEQSASRMVTIDTPEKMMALFRGVVTEQIHQKTAVIYSSVLSLLSSHEDPRLARAQRSYTYLARDAGEEMLKTLLAAQKAFDYIDAKQPIPVIESGNALRLDVDRMETLPSISTNTPPPLSSPSS